MSHQPKPQPQQHPSSVRRTPSPAAISSHAGGTSFGTSSWPTAAAASNASASGGARADFTPVRRQFLEAEVFLHNNGNRRDRGEDGPAGPSPDTILHEPTLPRSFNHALQQQQQHHHGGRSGGTMGAAARGTPSPVPPQPSRQGASTPSVAATSALGGAPTPSMMGPSAKSVPARSRALLQVLSAASAGKQSPILGAEAATRTVGAGRPGSGAVEGPSPWRGATPNGGGGSSGGVDDSSGVALSTGASSVVGATFEDELAEISRMHARERHAAHAAAANQRRRGEASLGSPGRAQLPSVEEQDAPMAPSAAGGEGAANTATGKPIHVPYAPDLRAKLGAGTAVHTHSSPKPMGLRDFEMLAEACQRAGRARMEGHAYYKIGETYAKNKDTLAKSVTYFKRYLNISRRLNDLQGESKALNCIGIVYHELGSHVLATTGNRVGAHNNFHIAMEYHKQHADIADAAGVFIANTNLGLLHSLLGNAAAALECHKQALQFAVRAGDKSAEALALANLGQAGALQGDIATARVCVERHLELATTLHDTEASSEAYEQLGALAAQRGDYTGATENLLLALDVAVREGNQERAKFLRCQVGLAQGMLRMEQEMQGAASRMGGTPEPPVL